jgi:hypothetical protein
MWSIGESLSLFLVHDTDIDNALLDSRSIQILSQRW